MDRLKSIFISAAISAWAYFHYFMYQEITEPTSFLSLIGLFLIATVPLSFFVTLLLIKPVARTTKSLPFMGGAIALGFMFLLFAVSQYSTPVFYAYLGSISLLMWAIYIYWYSVMPKSNIILKEGESLPKLTFKNGEENSISTTDFIDKKLLLLFYRGNWCPLCMAQIKEISTQYQALEQKGVKILMISPQPVSHSVNLAKKMNVNFHFLTDENNAMARKLNIDHQHGTPLGMEVFGYTSETVLPTVIITNEEGKILFLDQTDNYRIRPEPDTFLKVLDNYEKSNKSHEV